MQRQLQRGQAWGVMEVLVSVIILAMSMAIVFYVLKNVQDAQCVSELKSHTLAMQNALLDVALGSPPTTRRVVYKMPQCGEKSVEAMRFSYYAERDYCRACPGAYGGCWLIEPLVYDYKQGKLYRLADAITCVNMPADIELKKEDNAAKCLTDRLSVNFCPRFRPGSNSAPSQTETPQCDSSYAGVISQLHYEVTPRPIVQGKPNSGAKARAVTFVKKAGEKVFEFELTKQGGAGFQSTVLICPCANSNCRSI